MTETSDDGGDEVLDLELLDHLFHDHGGSTVVGNAGLGHPEAGHVLNPTAEAILDGTFVGADGTPSHSHHQHTATDHGVLTSTAEAVLDGSLVDAVGDTSHHIPGHTESSTVHAETGTPGISDAEAAGITPIPLSPPVNREEEEQLRRILDGEASALEVLHYAQGHGHWELQELPVFDRKYGWIFPLRDNWVLLHPGSVTMTADPPQTDPEHVAGGSEGDVTHRPEPPESSPPSASSDELPPGLSQIELTEPRDQAETEQLLRIREGKASPMEVLQYVQNHGHPELLELPFLDKDFGWIFPVSPRLTLDVVGALDPAVDLTLADLELFPVPASFSVGQGPAFRFNFPKPSKPWLEAHLETPNARVDVTLALTGSLTVTPPHPWSGMSVDDIMSSPGLRLEVSRAVESLTLGMRVSGLGSETPSIGATVGSQFSIAEMRFEPPNTMSFRGQGRIEHFSDTAEGPVVLLGQPGFELKVTATPHGPGVQAEAPVDNRSWFERNEERLKALGETILLTAAYSALVQAVIVVDLLAL